jgi:Uma2 family endonuclease
MTTYRFTVDEYERMGEAGILTEDSRVELICGDIVAMSPIGARHASCVTRLIQLLVRRALKDILVTAQNPVRLSGDSEPQPDLMLMRDGDYDEILPGPSDVFVVIEVSDSTRDFDRDTKLPIYAAAGIPEAWIVDLVADRIERYTMAGPDGYQMMLRSLRGGAVESIVIPSLKIPVDDILGSSRSKRSRSTRARRSGPQG